MTKAEEAALKAYPPIQMNDGEIVYPGYDKHTRDIYQDGYEQAEKETIEKAVAWLEANVWKYTGLDYTELSGAFRQAMEKEK